jgi:hypothetical protein
MSNAALSTVQQVITILMTIMGVVMALRPPKKGTRQEYTAIGAFVIFGVIGVVATYTQGKRLDVASEKQQHQLDAIEKNTEQLPTLKALPQVVLSKSNPRAYLGMEAPGIQFLPPGEMQVTAVCKNYGNTSALDVICPATLMTGAVSQKDFSKKIQEQWFRLFLEQVRSQPPKPLILIEPGQSGITDQRLPNYSEESVRQIDAGDRVLLFVGLTRFQDDAGKHQSEVCEWLESPVPNYLGNKGSERKFPPFSPPADKWHRCEVHNGVKF